MGEKTGVRCSQYEGIPSGMPSTLLFWLISGKRAIVLDHHLAHVAPAPIFTRLERPDDQTINRSEGSCCDGTGRQTFGEDFP